MSLDNWNQWDAQEPPPDFTDRAVDVMLRIPRCEKKPIRRWAVVSAIAAVLVATAAWGMIVHERTRAQQVGSEHVEPQPSAQPAPSATPELSGRQVQIPHTESAPEPKPHVVVEPRPAASASAPPSASVEPPRKPIIMPRCECAAGVICTCLE